MNSEPRGQDYEAAFRWLCRSFYSDPEGPDAPAAQVAIGVLSTRLLRAGWTEDQIGEAMLEEAQNVGPIASRLASIFRAYWVHRNVPTALRVHLAQARNQAIRDARADGMTHEEIHALVERVRREVCG